MSKAVNSMQKTTGRIRALRLRGYGGACGDAAIKINERIFAGKGRYVGGLNDFWLSKGRAIGHVAVLWQKHYWDANGLLTEEDLLDFGVLDTETPDYQHPKFTQKAAERSVLVEFESAEEVRGYFPFCARR